MYNLSLSTILSDQLLSFRLLAATIFVAEYRNVNGVVAMLATALR